MQDRLRRNRIAILVAIAVGLTCTGSIQSDGMTILRSEAADTAYAAEMGDDEVSAVEHSTDISSLTESSNESHVIDYVAKDWWKADISEYDDSLSLTSYEAAYSEPDYPLTTTHISVTSDFEIESSTTAEESTSESVTTQTTITTVAEPEANVREMIAAEPGTVVFYSSGFGHGVGMSQNGANFYAKYDGWTYDKILQFYYPGTKIVQTGTPETELMTVGGKTDTVVSILSQIVNNEMGPTFSAEAIKAQAVAAYTFYLYNGYGAGMICKPNPAKKIVDCVREVLGQVVYYNNKPALTMFTASSGGSTASCKDVFFMDIPYLVSFPVRHDDTVDPHYCSKKSFSVNALKSKLEKAYRVSLTGSPADWIQLELGDGGYVAYATIGGKVRLKATLCVLFLD
jgi:peptidoglycan hydrolase-like amidase